MSKRKKTDSSRAAVHQNGGFGGSLGFVLVCVGSTMGMGDTWTFPYRVGQYGGGAFLVPCALFTVLFGLVRPSAEFTIERRARTGTLGAYEHSWGRIEKNRLGYFLTWIPLSGSLGIAIGYAITMGWAIRILAGSVTGAILTVDTMAYFNQATDKFGSIPWHVPVVVITAGILMFKAIKEIGRISKVPMPSFLVLFAILAVRVALLPGVEEEYKSLLAPDWSDLSEMDTWVMAMGQAFFSLSITGSEMIVYGTYLAKVEDTPKASIRTAFFDTVVTMTATLAITPAVFALGIEPNAGPPLMSIILSGIFRQMSVGRLFTMVFFLSVVFAGITSLINTFEAVSESWQNRSKLPREAAAALCNDIALLVGISLGSEPKVKSWTGFITIIVVPFDAVLGVVSVYYILGYKEIREELEEEHEKPLGESFGPLVRYAYVPLVATAFILGIVYGRTG